MNQRLTKAERIRRRADYLRIQGGGRKLHIPSFVCFGVRPAAAASRPDAVAREREPVAETENPLTQLGITVSRRVGNAVVRNRVKRLVREAFRRHKADFPSGLELVLIARAEAAKVGYAQVERELMELGRRLCGAGWAQAPAADSADRSRAQ